MQSLSSRLTLVFKYLLPLFWGPTLLLAGWVPAILGHAHVSLPLLAASVATLSFGLMFFRLKRVRTDGQSLFVSNYIRDAVIPLSVVEGILEDRRMKGWIGPTTIRVVCRVKTPFGRAFAFLPPYGTLARGSGRSSVSGLLDQLIKNARRAQ